MFHFNDFFPFIDQQSPDMRLDSLFYTPRDLYVGAIVEFNKHTFLLASADEYVFSYMERPAEIENFPQSNLRVILTEVIRCVEENGGIKAMMATFLAKDPDDSGYVMESTFRDILHGFVGYNLSEHQVISIGNITINFFQKINVTFLHRKWISPRKLIPAQGKVFPRAVFTPRGSALQPRAKRGL